MLSTGLLMHGQIFADSHRHCAMREGGEDGHFWCKKGIGRTLVLVLDERCSRDRKNGQLASNVKWKMPPISIARNLQYFRVLVRHPSSYRLLYLSNQGYSKPITASLSWELWSYSHVALRINWPIELINRNWWQTKLWGHGKNTLSFFRCWSLLEMWTYFSPAGICCTNDYISIVQVCSLPKKFELQPIIQREKVECVGRKKLTLESTGVSKRLSRW